MPGQLETVGQGIDEARARIVATRESLQTSEIGINEDLDASQGLKVLII